MKNRVKLVSLAVCLTMALSFPLTGCDSVDEGQAEGNSVVEEEISETEEVTEAEDYGPSSEGLLFLSNNDGTAVLRGMGSCTDEEVIIPSETPDGDVVVQIGDGSKVFNRDVTRVVIPSTVTIISDYAFYQTDSMTEVVIPDSVVSIGSNAFRGCLHLPEISIPDSVTEIGESAFDYCIRLVIVELPEGASIGEMAFSRCPELSSINNSDPTEWLESNGYDVNSIWTRNIY